MKTLLHLHLILSLLFFNTFLAQAQLGISQTNTAHSMGLSNATVSVLGTDALYSNPANLMSIPQKTLLLNSQWLYGVNDLKPISLGGILPTSSGVIATYFQHLGFESLRENKWAFSYARQLTQELNGGIELSYYHSRITGLESYQFIGLKMGVQFQIIKNWYIGFLIQNPFYIFKKSENNTTPSVFRLGTSYSINPNLIICTEIYQNIQSRPSFKMGVEYKPSPKVSVLTGFQTQPISLSIGLGYDLKQNWTLDLAATSHSVLGITPALSLIKQF